MKTIETQVKEKYKLTLRQNGEDQLTYAKVTINGEMIASKGVHSSALKNFEDFIKWAESHIENYERKQISLQAFNGIKN